MDFSKICSFLLTFAILFTLSCSPSDEVGGVTVSDDGEIAGVTVTSDETVSKSAISEVVATQMIRLYNDNDLTTALDSMMTDESGHFSFSELPAGTYAITADDGETGGIKRSIEVLPGETTTIQINIYIYITQVFYIDSSTNIIINQNFYTINESADSNTTDSLTLRVLPGKEIPFSAEVQTDSGTVLVEYILKADKEGTIQIIEVGDSSSDTPEIITPIDTATVDTPLIDEKIFYAASDTVGLIHYWSYQNVEDSTILGINERNASLVDVTATNDGITFSNDSSEIFIGDSLFEESIAAGKLVFNFMTKDDAGSLTDFVLIGDEGKRMTLYMKGDSIFWNKNNDDLVQLIGGPLSLEANQDYSVELSWGLEGMQLFVNGTLVAENASYITPYQYASRSYLPDENEMLIGRYRFGDVAAPELEGMGIFPGYFQSLGLYSFLELK